MSKEGKIIVHTDPREAVRTHQENADWEYRDEAKFWYGIAQDMDKRFFNGFLYPDGKKVPAPYIAFKDLHNKNTIAKYDLYPDEYGIIGKITFNTAHYTNGVTDHGELIKVWERGRYSQGETLLHEYLHLWQEIGRGKFPVTGKRAIHNKEWHDRAKELGLNPEGPAGVHTRPATPGSAIDIFLREHGIHPPKDAYNVLNYDGKTSWASLLFAKDKPVKKGKSTLHKYTCPCCGLNVRIGVKEDPGIIHHKCSVEKGENVFFVKFEAGEQTIYKSK
jgi:hypothetical protein